MVLLLLPAISILAFRNHRIDLGDFSQAIGFGFVRSRDEGSADLGAVPAGFNTETKRLIGLDVARREILHWILSVGARFCIELGLRFSAKRFSFSSHRRAGRSPPARRQRDHDGGYLTERDRQHKDSKRNALSRPLPATRLPAWKATGFQVFLDG